MDNNSELATFGGGCFWCTEVIFTEVKGVEKVISGYSGGNAPGKPTYKEVCSGLTGHAEVVQITFQPAVISYKDLTLIFLTTHDPTSLNKQGADVGTQYRSVIFYHSEEQQCIANQAIQEVQPYFDAPIVTEVVPATTFYEAEEYHQNYYKNNPNQSYCAAVISPKLEKFRKLYASKLKQ